MNSTETRTPGKPVIVQAGGGDDVNAFGNTLHFMLTGEQTGGALAIGIGSVPPGGGPPPHIHTREDELFLILEGRFSVLANGEWTEIGPGGAAYTPRGNVHTFRNVGDTTGRMWFVVTPSGFENFYSECAEVFAAAGPPDTARILQICAEHGMEIVAPPS